MDEGNKTGGKGWGLFDSESVPGQALWRPLTHTFAQFGELVQTTPLRLAVRRHHIAGVGADPSSRSGSNIVADRLHSPLRTQASRCWLGGARRRRGRRPSSF